MSIEDKKDRLRIGFLIAAKFFENEEKIKEKMLELQLSLHDVYKIYRDNAHKESMEQRKKYYKENPEAYQELEFLASLQLEGINQRKKGN